LPVFFELSLVLGLKESIERHIPCRRECDGWKAWEIIIALILLNLAGGEHIEDIELLEQDRGLAEVMFRVRYRDYEKRRRHVQRHLSRILCLGIEFSIEDLLEVNTLKI